MPRRMLRCLRCMGWLALLLDAAPAAAQTTTPPLVTDRPDFTESAATVPPGGVQLESGYTFARVDGGEEHALGEVLLRIGVTPRLEARLGLNSYAWMDGPGADPSGVEDPDVGMKLLLAQGSEAGVGIDVALLIGTSVPLGHDDVGEEEWQPGVVLALARDLTAGAALGANLGYTYAAEGGDRFDQGAASLALGLELSERWGSYVEAFGLFPGNASGDDAAVLNGGFTWLAHPMLQLDARVGAGLTDAAPDFFAGVGLARRW